MSPGSLESLASLESLRGHIVSVDFTSKLFAHFLDFPDILDCLDL